MHSNNLIANDAPINLPPFEEVSGKLVYSMTNDLLCKMLLERNEPVLKALLASLLRIPRESITDIQILNPYLYGHTLLDKDVILDLQATINHSFRINLEIQVNKETFWRERSILYSGRLFDFLSTGEPYSKLQRSIHIGILDFDLFPEEQAQFYSRFMFMNEQNHEIYSDKLQIVVLQLNQLNHATEEDKVHNIHLWARFFKATTWEELNMLSKEEPIFMDAARTIHEITADEINRANLRYREKYLASMRTRDEIDQQKDALISQQGEQLSQQAEQLSQQAEQLSQQAKHISQQDEQLSQQAEQLSQQAEQLSQQAEQISKMAEMIAELKAELAKHN